MTPIRRVAVLGAGTMGARIAAHFANAGIPCLLLDVDGATAGAAIERLLDSRPPAFFTPESARLIETGGFDSDPLRIRDCDWILEAAPEDLATKRSLWWKILPHRRPGAIVSTTTSSLSIRRSVEGFPVEFRSCFLGTHFFNPPRYVHLLELVPGPETRPEVIETVARFCEERLGKGTVFCKDTPGFIANRLGAFLIGTIQKLTPEYGFGIEAADLLTGRLIGFPKSAAFGLLDRVGLDVWAQLTRSLAESAPEDKLLQSVSPVAFEQEMIARGWLGEKAGGGFYRRSGASRELLAINLATLEYRPAAAPRLESIAALRKTEPLSERLRLLTALPDYVGAFLWRVLSDYIVYAAGMIPEITGRVVEIDRAMRWGYGHALGPFEMWDALGFRGTARRIASEGRVLPESVERMLSTGAASFYLAADSEGQVCNQYFDFASAEYHEVETRSGILILSDLKRARGVIRSNAGASLIDIGDDVICCEFHGKMNSLGKEVFEIIDAGLALLDRDFRAMILGNQGEHFSAGADLRAILAAAENGRWAELDAFIHRFQQVNMALKCAAKPVVAAPFAMTLGGGCETAMHCARSQASAELYMGLVEMGVGLIPAGGGCKEMAARHADPVVLFRQIVSARVSSSAEEARALSYLLPQDRISINPERLLADARRFALELAPDFTAGVLLTIPVTGEDGYRRMMESVSLSGYDAVVAERLAYVLSGGAGSTRPLTEQHLLDLEREAFLTLCGYESTRRRIAHMLTTGAPLRD